MKTIYTGLVIALLVAAAAAKEEKDVKKGKRELPVGPGHAYLPPAPIASHSYSAPHAHSSGPSNAYLPPVHHHGFSHGISHHGNGLDISSIGFGAGGPATTFVSNHLGHIDGGFGHKNVATFVSSAGGKGPSFNHGSHGFGSGHSYGGGYKVATLAAPSQTYGAAAHGAFSSSGHVDRGYSVGGASVHHGHSDFGSSTGFSDAVGYSHGGSVTGLSSLGEHAHSYGASAGDAALSYASSHDYSASSPAVQTSYSHAASGPDFSQSHGASAFGQSLNPGSSYTYSQVETPAHSHTISIPASSYGVPLAPPLTSYTPQFHSAGQAASASNAAAGTNLPGYAAGHKGLGHFQSSESSIGTEKAPFKPSVFLGASHETHQAPSNQYLPPVSSHQAPSNEYLPPAATFEAALHGNAFANSFPSSSHVHASPSESHSHHQHQLPHQTYGPPAASPGNTYLPPSTNYGVPTYSHHH